MISETPDLALLNNLACQDDQILAAEIKRKMDYRGHNITDWKAGGGSKMWAGDNNAFGVTSRSHNFTRFIVFDYADVNLGDVKKGNNCKATLRSCYTGQIIS